jgi:hypothetical protein
MHTTTGTPSTVYWYVANQNIKKNTNFKKRNITHIYLLILSIAGNII